MNSRTYIDFMPQKAHRGSIDRETAVKIFLAEGKPSEIARRFRVTRTVVYDIKAGRSWGYATGVDGRAVRSTGTGRYDDPVKGAVILYSRSGGKIVERRYVGASGRRRVLADLKGSLGPERFDKLTIHFRPDLKPASLEAVNLENPDPVTFGLKADREAFEEAVEMGGEICDLHPEAANASHCNSLAPSFDDLGGAVGLDRSAQIDRILDQIEQVA
jgi:hypothetical protein